jgi:hypothetical protein
MADSAPPATENLMFGADLPQSSPSLPAIPAQMETLTGRVDEPNVQVKVVKGPSMRWPAAGCSGTGADKAAAPAA